MEITEKNALQNEAFSMFPYKKTQGSEYAMQSLRQLLSLINHPTGNSDHMIRNSCSTNKISRDHDSEVINMTYMYNHSTKNTNYTAKVGPTKVLEATEPRWMFDCVEEAWQEQSPNLAGIISKLFIWLLIKPNHCFEEGWHQNL